MKAWLDNKGFNFLINKLNMNFEPYIVADIFN